MFALYTYIFIRLRIYTYIYRDISIGLFIGLLIDL